MLDVMNASLVDATGIANRKLVLEVAILAQLKRTHAMHNVGNMKIGLQSNMMRFNN